MGWAEKEAAAAAAAAAASAAFPFGPHVVVVVVVIAGETGGVTDRTVELQGRWTGEEHGIGA